MREEFARKLKQAEDEFKRKEDEVRVRSRRAGFEDGRHFKAVI